MALSGWTRKHNPNKRYGPQQDVWCAFETGAVINAFVIPSDQSEFDSFKACVELLCNPSRLAITSTPVNNIVCLDRGYSGIRNVVHAAENGIYHIGGIKKNTSSFTDKENIRAKVTQKYVNPIGCATPYYSFHYLTIRSRNNAKEKVVNLCLRNGSGKLVHLQHLPIVGIAPFEIDYEFEEHLNKPRSTVDDEMTEWERTVMLVTSGQGTPDWFLMRMFKFSSTTAGVVMRLFKSQLFDDVEYNWILPHAGIQLVHNESSCPLERLTFASTVAINDRGITTNSLKEWIAKYNIPKLPVQSGETTKLNLFRSFINGLQQDSSGAYYLDPPTPPSEEYSEMLIRRRVFEASMKSWFYNRKASKGGDDADYRKNFLAGHINEAKILSHLVPEIRKKYPDAVINKVKTYGLVLKEPGIVASPDGIIDVKLRSADECSKLFVVECKTKRKTSTIAPAQTLANSYGQFVECDFDSPECEALVGEWRMQVLHQAATTGIMDVLLVVASTTTIIYSVYVKFTEEDLNAWLFCLRKLINQCLPWILDVNTPLAELPQLPESGIAGCVDDHTFHYYWILSSKMMQAIQGRGYPFPPATRIVPSEVQYFIYFMFVIPLLKISFPHRLYSGTTVKV